MEVHELHQGNCTNEILKSLHVLSITKKQEKKRKQPQKHPFRKVFGCKKSERDADLQIVL